ncbi:MAG TPA: DUF559 domain-containing protein [Rhizobiales bacterium]|nr:DUF559 domain-containing protein [Gammaproteobacteria bacterium]HDO51542.1 DUF559 domain-containing protein [Hyphomicrobiales bacterium]
MVVRLSLLEAERLGLAEDLMARRARLRRRGGLARGPDAPQARLLRIVRSVYPEAVSEFRPISERRFRADVAIPQARLLIECDGWEHHGRYKADFTRDRERDRVLVLAGWRVLRFTAGEIRKIPGQVAEVVRRAVSPSAGNCV